MHKTHGESAPDADLRSSPVATSRFAERRMVSMPTCASLACSRSAVDFVAVTIARRATTTVVGVVDFAEQGHRSVERTRPV
ncbi:unnamed protein product [Closterium sp. NIES-54]